MSYRRLYFALIPLLLALGQAATVTVSFASELSISQELLNHVEKKYGKEGRVRLEQLAKLVKNYAEGSELEKVTWVNLFYNKVRFETDPIHWKLPDYWATPVEKLATGAGDCEDYAIAKYFTLKEMGVPEDKMRIMYVYAGKTKEPHVVMTYYEKKGAVPLVLDNINKRLLPASKRDDLVPVFTFNGTSLWSAKARGTGKKIGGKDTVTLWGDLMKRMDGSLP